MFMRFDELFSKRLQTVPRLVKKHEKSSIWPKLFNFSNKLPCLCISMNFSGKSCKKCLISWKSTKSRRFAQNLQLFDETTMFRRFGQLFSKKLQNVANFEKMQEKSSILPKLATFRENYHVSAFWWTFRQKVAKSASFREKTRKPIDLAKLCNFFEQTTMFWCFDELLSKRFQKVAQFVKKHEKSSIWPNLFNFSN